VPGAGLFLGRRDNPDVVAKLPHDGLEQPQSAGVHAIVVGQEDPHVARGYGGRAAKPQPKVIAPYSQQLGDLFARPS
jgi:hypothetical protein